MDSYGGCSIHKVVGCTEEENDSACFISIHVLFHLYYRDWFIVEIFFLYVQISQQLDLKYFSCNSTCGSSLLFISEDHGYFHILCFINKLSSMSCNTLSSEF